MKLSIKTIHSVVQITNFVSIVNKKIFKK